MAGGRGSRFGALKQFASFGPNGEFLMEYSIYDALQCGFEQIVLITGEDSVPFLRDYFRSRLPEKVELHVLAQGLDDLPAGMVVQNRTKPWGTAHAVWTARHVVSNPFAVVNADDFYGRSAYAFAAELMDQKLSEAQAVLVPYVLEETLSAEGPVSRGICLGQAGQLTGIEEVERLVRRQGRIVDLDSDRSFEPETPVSMNFWAFTPEVFVQLEADLKDFLRDEKQRVKEGRADKAEIFIPKQVQTWIKEKGLQVYFSPLARGWFGVTYQKDKTMVEQNIKSLVDQNLYPSALWTT